MEIDTRILNPGDFILFSGKGFISRGICAFTNSRWSHIAIFTGDGYVIEATAAGVEKNLLAPLVIKADHVAIVRIPDLTVENMERMKDAAYAMLSVGLKYDFWQLFTLAPYFMLRKIGINAPWLIWDKSGAVSCSALCAQCASIIPLKFAKSIKLVAPETIYRSPLVMKIFDK